MFALKGSLGAELDAFKLLAQSDPLLSKKRYENGERLIALAGNGELAQFKRFVGGLNAEEIMSYFTAKALISSLVGGHLMLSAFILDNGFPLNSETGLPNILQCCLKELSDYECASIVMLLSSKGVDVNRQVCWSLIF